MATYAIGDVQGCYQSLQALLQHIDYDSNEDVLWFTGDLVNRGAESLEVLRFVKDLGDKAINVLGNHDLHLLAVMHQLQPENPDDNMDDVLNAPDREALCDWLRQRPLIHHDAEYNFTLVHAGLAPQWDLQQALSVAKEVETVLQGDHYLKLLKAMYGDEPAQWEDSLRGDDRLRFIINCFTRIRFCDTHGQLDLTTKGDLGQQKLGFFPWFAAPSRRNRDMNVIFGHWAALYNDWNSVVNEPGIYPLDSGCVWGNALTALRLEDRQRFAVKCKE